jgi:hypothetical protein
MLGVSFGTNKCSCKEQLMKHTLKASSVKMPATVVLTLMLLFTQVQEHIFVVKNQL